MSHLDLNGLQRYAQKEKAWADARFASAFDMNWQKTLAAGAVSFSPVQRTPLDVSVDFLFAEVPPASGDKGPSNPSTITGVSSVNVGRVGKNLLLKVASNQTVGTVAMTPQSDGSYIINGTTSGNMNIAITDCGPEFGTPVYSSVRLNANKNYTLTATILEGSVSGTVNVAFGYGSESGQYVAFYFINGVASYTFNSSYFPDGHFIARIRAMAGASFSNAKIVFQLEEGDTTTAFEAPMLPADANNTIALGSTYYGGTLDVASGVMTVTWWGEYISSVTHTAASILQTNTVGASYVVSHRGFGASRTTTDLVCDKFEAQTGDGDVEHVRLTGCSGGSLTQNVYINKSRLDLSGASDPNNPTVEEALAAINAWLAVNPVFIAYKLFTPFTVQLTPTEILSLAQSSDYDPRVNTVYGDASTVQVGYPKSPQATLTELTNAIISLGGNV